MGQKKTCGNCGQLGHNARTCKSSGSSLDGALGVPAMQKVRSIFRRQVQCTGCGTFGHNKTTCPKVKERKFFEKEARIERRANLKALFERNGFAPGALVQVSVYAADRNNTYLVPAMVLSMEDTKDDKGILAYKFNIQKFGKPEDYPGIGDYIRFGKEDAGVVSLSVELEQKYALEYGDFVGSYSSTKLLVAVEPGRTFSQFYDKKFMAGE